MECPNLIRQAFLLSSVVFFVKMKALGDDAGGSWNHFIILQLPPPPPWVPVGRAVWMCAAWCQVWSPTQIFMFPFCEKSLHSMTLVREILFSSVPCTNSRVSSWTLEGLFELTQRPSRDLNSPRALLQELQRYTDSVRCAVLGTEVPRHHQEQLTYRWAV